jgi:uncharacterized protein YjbJ (UPF0337 family)
MGERADEIRRYDDSDDRTETTASLDAAADPDTAELRVEIEHTRVEMSETIDAIQQRLNPSTLADEAKDAARDAAEHAFQHAKEAVRDATIGRAEDAVRTVSSTAQDVIYSAGDTASEAGESIMETIKHNPIPAALTGIGLVWLFMNRQGAPSHSRPTMYRDRGAYGAYQGWYPTGASYPGSSPYPPGSGRYQAAGAYGRPESTAEGMGDKARETAGAIADKVQDSAGNLADKVQDTAGTIADQAQDVMYGAGHRAGAVRSTMMDTIRENPIPAALAGLSLGWLFMNRQSSSSHRPGMYADRSIYSGSQPYYQGRGMSGQYYGGGRYYGGEQESRNLAGQAQERVSHLAGQAQDTVGNLAGQAQDTAGNLAGQAQETVGYLTDQAQYQAQRLEDRFQGALYENPLAVGAVAVAVGAVIGMVVPETRQEHQFMGEARDSLIDRAQGVAQDTLEKVQHVAEEVQSTVKQEADNQGLTSTTGSKETPNQGATI